VRLSHREKGKPREKNLLPKESVVRKHVPQSLRVYAICGGNGGFPTILGVRRKLLVKMSFHERKEQSLEKKMTQKKWSHIGEKKNRVGGKKFRKKKRNFGEVRAKLGKNCRIPKICVQHQKDQRGRERPSSGESQGERPHSKNEI